jgi:hypothetical protein
MLQLLDGSYHCKRKTVLGGNGYLAGKFRRTYRLFSFLFTLNTHKGSAKLHGAYLLVKKGPKGLRIRLTDKAPRRKAPFACNL